MAEKLWKGRFEQPTDKLVEEYTASVHFDSRLYRHDIEGSIAHCRMLAECGIISHDEASLIVQTLGEILRDIERGKIELDSSQEDIHMAIENELTARIGETGGKLHTARSRNDQIALDMRLFMREALSGIMDLVQPCPIDPGGNGGKSPRHDHAGLYSSPACTADPFFPSPDGLL